MIAGTYIDTQSAGNLIIADALYMHTDGNAGGTAIDVDTNVTSLAAYASDGQIVIDNTVGSFTGDLQIVDAKDDFIDSLK